MSVGKLRPAGLSGSGGELPNNPSDVVSIAHQDRLTITDQFVRPRRPTRGHWPGDCHDGIS
ncbi:hypothetical protein PA07A_0031 [Cutibacterium acnes P07A]|nr:hypothetical protein [Cutibacterium acnes P07A]